ncbi:MAG TPA: peptide-N4-asparagine amidase, partial [Dyella sp.]|uniref:peptide-N4-asparagine amidase n=1 Tax=Dyella sp. TaxID=1869338 RepID=UPI002CC01C1F
MDIQSIRRSVVDTLGMDLANVRLFRDAVPRYGGATNGSPVNWHVERDLTDYSALFKLPQSGLLWSTQNFDAVDFIVDSFAFNASAKLVFYPATAATPAPRVPDAVIAANQGQVNLPHNIERAYLDVENDYPGNAFWYTCVSNDSGNLTLDDIFAPGGTPYDTSIYPPRQGCGGGDFQEIHIGVDGTPAGIAPAFPLVVADLNWSLQNSANQPITTLEMLNFKPYRVDLTPFAAILSAPGAHNVTADNDDAGGGGATLLLYLDPHSSQVSGAVTLNTLASENGAATDTDTLKQTGETIRGDIKTREHRNFEIRGFVYTSHGRIDSRVQQTSDFISVQAF